MPRILLALALALLVRGNARAQDSAQSIVYFAHEERAIEQFTENETATRRMVDQLVTALTRQPDPARAWRSLVTPADRVGIKVAAAGGRYFSSHRGVVDAIVAGLESAGVPRAKIVIWDRDSARLGEAGFAAQPGGPMVRAVDPPRGYDREATFTASTLGKLIWGDLLFVEKAGKSAKRKREEDQLSSTSHLARILTRDITKIINVPVLSDEAGIGVAGALYNVTVPNADNWRRLVQRDAGDAVAELYADPRIGPRVVLTIMDGLRAQYAGGPAFQPGYSFPHATLYASRDPVALDAHAARLIDGWRVEAKLPPIAKRTEWLQTAAALGLGQCEEGRIELRSVAPTP